jgi:RsiW-degrading membrane proteinase PrsW (M82 family)
LANREKKLTWLKSNTKTAFDMGLLALAIAPGIAICIFIYYKDKYNKEPVWMLLLAFVLGILSIIPAVIIQVASGVNSNLIQSKDGLTVAYFTFCIIAMSEEGSKFLMLRAFIFPRKHFDDPFDGIVYAVMIGMGFATIENIGYVYENGWRTGILRMFLSVPAHGTFAVLMGYFTGFAKFKTNNKLYYFFPALLLPVIFHGAFDFFIFKGTGSLLTLGAIVSFLLALFLSFKAISNKQNISKSYYEEKNRSFPGDVSSL